MCQRLPLHKDGTVGLLGPLLILVFGGELVALLRVQRVAKHVYKEVPQKAFLVLLLLGCADVGLNVRIVEVRSEHRIGRSHGGRVQLAQVFS